MRKPRRAMLKEGNIILCGNPIAALLLERIMYRSSRGSSTWVHTSSADIARDAICGCSGSRARREIEHLASSGLLYIRKSARRNCPHGYMPAWTSIHESLHEIGFRLSKRIYGRTEGYMDHETQRKRDQEWDDIPGKQWPESSKTPTQGSLEEIRDRHKWAQRYKIMDSAPPVVLDVSWALWECAGIEPTGAKKSWFSGCFELASIAGDDDTLRAAITEGNKARQEHGITISGPRSFLKFASNARSLRNMQGRRQDAPGKAKGEGALHGQRKAADRDGNDVIILGKR